MENFDSIESNSSGGGGGGLARRRRRVGGTPILEALRNSFKKATPNAPRRRRPDDDDEDEEEEQKLGLKTLLVAIFMLVAGTILLVVGLRVYLRSQRGDKHNGIEMIVLGCILFLPGIYAGLVMLGAHLGWSGYHYQDIPTLDSDEADSDTAGLLQTPSRRAYNLSTNPSMQYNNRKGNNIGSVTEESK